MGSATTQARAATLAAVTDAGSADFATGEQLLAAGRVIGDSAQLLGVLSDASIAPADKSGIVDALFGSYSAAAKAVLSAAVSSPWSGTDDLLGGIEEAGIRVLAASAPKTTNVDAELFTFAEAVSSNQELELAISSKLGPADARAGIVRSLIGGDASAQTVAILEHLVRQPRGRRIGALVQDAARVVADAADTTIATVTTATALPAAQVKRLEAALATSNGRPVRVNHIIDPSVIGGMRVQIGDDVIDGTISAKLADLTLQLAR